MGFINKNSIDITKFIKAFVDDLVFHFNKEWDIQGMLTTMELIFYEYGFVFNFDKTYYYDYENNYENEEYFIDCKKISKVPNSFHYLGQPLIVSDNVVENMYVNIRDVLHRINSLDINNIVKLALYRKVIYYRLNRFYELLHMCDDNVYSKLLYWRGTILQNGDLME